MLRINPTPARPFRQPRPVRRPARPLLPAEHAALIERLSRRLDDIERTLADLNSGRRADRLQRRRLRLLRDIVNAEAENEEASQPVAYRQADNGPGIVVMTRGGWEVSLPDHTAMDGIVMGLDELPF